MISKTLFTKPIILITIKLRTFLGVEEKLLLF